MSVIDRLRERLAERSPPIPFEVRDKLITVPAIDENGFDVSLRRDRGFCEVRFDAWHEIFEDEEEAIRCFLFGLSNECRLRVESAGDLPYKWTVEHEREGEWTADSTTGLLLFPFWRKRTVRYLQNDRL